MRGSIGLMEILLCKKRNQKTDGYGTDRGLRWKSKKGSNNDNWN